MKASRLWLLILLATAGISLRAQVAKPVLPPGVRSNFETVTAPVLKVFAARDAGYAFESYLVKWHGQEVIVSCPLAFGGKMEGDMITFLAQYTDIANGGNPLKLLSFTVVAKSALPAPTPTPEPKTFGPLDLH